MNKFFFFLIVLSLFSGCSRWATLGMKGHQFDGKGKHIVWIQVDGLAPEHFAFLKFPSELSNQNLAIEQSACVAQMWNYNLYNMRPSAGEGFMAQTLGSKNILGKCRDMDRDPVWSFFGRQGYSTGMFSSRKSSWSSYLKCSEAQTMLKDVWHWKRSPNKSGAKTFHFQEKLLSTNPETLYDKSCDKKGCVVDFSTHVKKVWETFSDKRSKTFFIIQDSLYAHYLNKKDGKRARSRLAMLDSLYGYFVKKSEKDDIAVVMTSSAAVKVDFPAMGKKWHRFNKLGRGLKHKSTSLNSYLWAKGKGVENFCGTYNESDVFTRFLWMPEGSFLDSFSF